MTKPDSIIFDMDGTLWDAVDIYTEAWNRGLSKIMPDRKVTRDEIASMTGWEKQQVLDQLLPGHPIEVHEKVYEAVNECSPKLMDEMDGIVYEGVKEGLEALSKKYRLFIVSNCAAGAIQQFLKRTGISGYITDEMAHGVNLQPKHYNIKLLMEKHGLKNPVYVGDTEGDSRQSRLAGIPFVFMSFGFGRTEIYNMKFDTFRSFSEYFMAL